MMKDFLNNGSNIVFTDVYLKVALYIRSGLYYSMSG